MTMPTREFDSAPPLLPLYARAAAPALPGIGGLPGVRRTGDELPDVEFVHRGAVVDVERLAAYTAICGFTLRDTLPATYPHLLAFPLHLALLTDRAFPFAAMGLVHVENRISHLRPLRGDDVFDVHVHATDLRPHPKGQQFDIVSEAVCDGEPAWREVSTMLRRGGGAGEASGEQSSGSSRESPSEWPPVSSPAGERSTATPPAGTTRWPLSGRLGRRYAAVSGDRNPIHLSRPTAKAFGFARPIAHGMWSKARCLAALEPRLPDAFEVRVEFKKPILLPGTVTFGAADTSDGLEFALHDAAGSRTHVLGQVRTSPPAS